MAGPSASAHQVLVYSGSGVSPLSLSHTVLTLSLLLLPHYTVQPVTASTLATQPWEPSCALLVVPGGRDLPFVDELSVKTKVTRRIKAYVQQGGRYLGICAGAYFGAEQVRFDSGGSNEVVGQRDLAFFPGACAGPTYRGFAYAAESGARAVSLILEGQATSSRVTLDHLYYNGGGHFVLPSPLPSHVRPIATYTVSASDGTESPVAAVLIEEGEGRALLCSVHFEYPLNDPPARDAISRLSPVPDQEDVARSEAARIAWAEELLRLVGLNPPNKRDLGSEYGSKSHLEGDEEPSLLLHPTHPSPIFVFSHPLLPELGLSSFSSPALQQKLSSDDRWQRLDDSNDALRIAPVYAVSGAPSSEGEVAAYLARQRRSPPPAPPPIDSLSLEDGKAALPQPPDFQALLKTILLPSPKLSYSPRWTPLFNFDTYWTALDDARKGSGRKSGKSRKDETTGAERTVLGDLVWYAETVTSTQTMLDRNTLLLSHLPSPLAFLASFQLTGRGRGSNVWLSPPGCLQFSLLLSLPQSMSSKLVFIQYLMALAVADAIDEDGRLGVRIKWPNDIYAEAEGVGDAPVGSGKKGKAKLGGILVNTNLINGEWRVVVGCGVNILNALPTTSLSQLHSLLTSRATLSGQTGKPLPPAPTMEGCFARVMHAFELKWEQFLENRGFESFMDEYYGRWLHTNQEVTLTTVEPHQRLRIKGITSDYGLLRCVPLPSTSSLPPYARGDHGSEYDRAPPSFLSTSSKKEEFVDLQPDGNSFDLMSGLIKRKT